MAAMIIKAKQFPSWAACERPLDLVLKDPKPFDPIGAPGKTIDQVAILCEAGATIINVNFIHHSRDHYIEQLEALVALKV